MIPKTGRIGRYLRWVKVLRKGNVGYNNAEAEKQYHHRTENEWPIARAKYTRYFLTPDKHLTESALDFHLEPKLSYKPPGGLKNPEFVQFTSAPFQQDTEITGHIVVHLNVSLSATQTVQIRQQNWICFSH